MASSALHFDYDDIDIFVASSFTKRTNRSSWTAYALQDDESEIYGEVIDIQSNYAALLVGVIKSIHKTPECKSVTLHSTTKNFLRGVNERLLVWEERDWKFSDPDTGELKPITAYEGHWQEIKRLKDERTIRFRYANQLVSEYYCNHAKKLSKWLLNGPIDSHYACEIVFDLE